MTKRFLGLSFLFASLRGFAPLAGMCLSLGGACVSLAGVCVSLAAPAHAQDAAQTEALEKVELRVTTARIGAVVVDRGTSDGLAVGDRVLFFPREGGTFEGTVVEVLERSATVSLRDPGFAPAPGTRGEVRVPSARRGARAAPAPVETETVPTESPEHPPWERAQEQEWTNEQPLLAQVRPLGPESRPMRVSGRWYSIVDQTWSGEDSRTDFFGRAGGGVLYENLFGNGGNVHLDGEVNYRHTDVSDNDDEEKTRVRLDRLSYEWGGTRFADSRVEVGRFLQYELPELGVLDGMEWGTRTNGGDHFGFSAGFMPEPDAEQDTGDDLQLAGFYRWVSDESERFAITGAYQKTWHDLSADRDLVVAKLDYLPIDGWSLRGTTWFDIYGSTDDAKGAGVELTEAYVTAGRAYEDRSSIYWTYNHVAFPELERDEFTPVTEAQLADNHNDRFAFRTRWQFAKPTALLAEGGWWVDEDDDGGDGELGLEVDDLFARQGVWDVGVFATSGQFETVLGWRTAFGRTFGSSHWRIGYEYSKHDLDGFSSDNDDLPQHRATASYDVHTASGWSFSAHVYTVIWEDEEAVTVGFYLQRNF